MSCRQDIETDWPGKERTQHPNPSSVATLKAGTPCHPVNRLTKTAVAQGHDGKAGADGEIGRKDHKQAASPLSISSFYIR